MIFNSPLPVMKKQFGFTLLEMLLVLFLVGLMASATLMLTDNIEDQSKYEETKHRMDMIRKAIIGDPTRTVNGGSEISGFVADMGRLPECIAELLALGAEKVPVTVPKTYDSPCDADKTITTWSLDDNTGIGFGWRGPYIQVLPERNGDLRFRDGYGNSDADNAIDAKNSGWTWKLFDKDDAAVPAPPAPPIDGEIIRVQSKSFDNTAPYPTGDIDDADPDNRPSPLIVSSDWQVQLPAAVNVTFKNQSPNDLPVANENLVLRIYLSDLTTSIEGDDGSNDYLTLDASTALANANKTTTFILNSSSSVALGNRAYSIVCYEKPSGDPTGYVIFDGDCDTGLGGNSIPSTSNIRLFSVIPRQSLNLNLDWTIQ